MGDFPDDDESIVLGYSASMLHQPVENDSLHGAGLSNSDEPPTAFPPGARSSVLSYFLYSKASSSVRVHSKSQAPSKKSNERRFSISAGVINLQNWTVQPAVGSDGIIVRGHNQVDGMERKSCPIATRICSDKVVSKTGLVYQLIGPMNVNKCAESKMARKYFGDGFPANWRQMKVEYLNWFRQEAMQCEIITSPRVRKLKKFVAKSRTPRDTRNSSEEEDKENSSASDSDLLSIPSATRAGKNFCKVNRLPPQSLAKTDSIFAPCAPNTTAENSEHSNKPASENRSETSNLVDDDIVGNVEDQVADENKEQKEVPRMVSQRKAPLKTGPQGGKKKPAERPKSSVKGNHHTHDSKSSSELTNNAEKNGPQVSKIPKSVTGPGHEDDTEMDEIEWLYCQPDARCLAIQTNTSNADDQVSSLKTIFKWSIALFRDCVHVEGMLSLCGSEMLYRTSPISSVAKQGHLLTTTSGSKYTLSGEMDMAATLRAGVPLNIARRFTKGFPREWKSCVKRMVNLNRSDSGSYQGETRQADQSALNHGSSAKLGVYLSLESDSEDEVAHASNAVTNDTRNDALSSEKGVTGKKKAPGWKRSNNSVDQKKNKYASALTPVVETRLSLEQSVVAVKEPTSGATVVSRCATVTSPENKTTKLIKTPVSTDRAERSKRKSYSSKKLPVHDPSVVITSLLGTLNASKTEYKTRSGRKVKPCPFNFVELYVVNRPIKTPKQKSRQKKEPMRNATENSTKTSTGEQDNSGEQVKPARTPSMPIESKTPYVDKKGRKSNVTEKPKRRKSDAVKELYSPGQKTAERGLRSSNRRKVVEPSAKDCEDISLTDITKRDYAVPITPLAVASQRFITEKACTQAAAKNGRTMVDNPHRTRSKDRQGDETKNKQTVKKRNVSKTTRTKKDEKSDENLKVAAHGRKRANESSQDGIGNQEKRRKVTKQERKEEQTITKRRATAKTIKAKRPAKQKLAKKPVETRTRKGSGMRSQSKDCSESSVEKKSKETLKGKKEHEAMKKHDGATPGGGEITPKGKWTYNSKKKLGRLVDKELNWEEIAKLMGFSADECQEMYKNMFKQKKKNATRKKNSESETATRKEITANRGTLKHRKQVREKLEILKQPKPQTQDLFAAGNFFGESDDAFSADLFSGTGSGAAPTTPFTKSWAGPGEAMATPSWFKTPTLAGVSSSNTGWTPYIQYKTPAHLKQVSSQEAEVFAEDKKTKEADRVIVQMRKKMKGKLHANAKKAPRSKDKGKKQITGIDFEIFRREEKPPSEGDSEEEDHYFSES